MRRTKIICTLGPAVDDPAKIRELMLSGMNCARLNFSHGDHEEQAARIAKVKEAREELGLPVAILLDTKGPEIRLGNFENGYEMLNEGDIFTLTPKEELGTTQRGSLSYPKLAKAVKSGTHVLIDDGKIDMEVVDIVGGDVVCKVLNGGKVSNHKSVNVPNVAIPTPYISKADLDDIVFGIEQGIDYIACSFVRSADDVRQVRALLSLYGAQDVKIISKIENTQGIEHLDEIIDVSDGIMVARGDMGVEVPFRELPAIQKMIIEKCYRKGKHVVTATQMLESMISSPRPTRAEVSDVANAIYDGTTAIMLSGEVSVGQYPVETVRTMAAIAEAAENAQDYVQQFTQNHLQLGKNLVDALAQAACDAAHYLGAKAIVVVTRSGKTAQLLSNYRPACPIIGAVVSQKGYRQLNLAWGVSPILASEQESPEQLACYATKCALEAGAVVPGDLVIVVSGTSLEADEQCNMLRIERV